MEGSVEHAGHRSGGPAACTASVVAITLVPTAEGVTGFLGAVHSCCAVLSWFIKSDADRGTPRKSRSSSPPGLPCNSGQSASRERVCCEPLRTRSLSVAPRRVLRLRITHPLESSKARTTNHTPSRNGGPWCYLCRPGPTRIVMSDAGRVTSGTGNSDARCHPG